VFIRVTTGDTHDVNILDQIIFQPGAYYVMDRGYLDYCRLPRLLPASSHPSGRSFLCHSRQKQPRRIPYLFPPGGQASRYPRRSVHRPQRL
jgi:hypothetical protein